MRFKNIILVNPFPEAAVGINEATIYPPVGLAYLGSILRKHGMNVKIIDANILRFNNKQVLDMIILNEPDLVGISLNIVTGKEGIKLARMIKEKTRFNVCLGGPLASSCPDVILNASVADIVVVGEGERTLLAICEGRNITEIKGIVYKSKDGKIVTNKRRDLIDNLDDLPFPSYDLLPSFKLYHSRARRSPIGTIFTSRGCPYNCTFCNSNIFGRRFRAFSPEYILNEIEYLVRQYGIRQLDILDDNLTFDTRRAELIFDMIIEKKLDLAINLQNGVRADRLNRRLVKKMKKAGVFKVGMGIESGDKRTLREIKKNLDLQKVIQAIEWFRKEGIITIGNFILGFPTETKESIEKTIRFAIKANPSIANFMILIPLPGTEIYEYLEKKGLLEGNLTEGVSSGFYEPHLYHKCLYLTRREVFAYQTQAYKKFYLRINKIIETLSQVRSFNEIKWYFKASAPLFKRVLLKIGMN